MLGGDGQASGSAKPDDGGGKRGAKDLMSWVKAGGWRLETAARNTNIWT